MAIYNEEAGSLRRQLEFEMRQAEAASSVLGGKGETVWPYLVPGGQNMK